MRREIKFRGKSTETNELVYGSLVQVSILGSLAITTLDDKGHLKVQEIIKGTEGQYTGLNDKKGVEIYDGDIIDGSWINPMSQEKVIRQYKVTFNKGKYNAELIGHHPYGSTMLYFENENAEVIGNIYENPELIEV